MIVFRDKVASGLISTNGKRLVIAFEGGGQQTFALEKPFTCNFDYATYNAKDYKTEELVEVGLIKLSDILDELDSLREYKKKHECAQPSNPESFMGPHEENIPF